MIDLTDQQVESLKDCQDVPPRVVNPRTGAAFVLLRAEDYERLRTLLQDPNPADFYPAIDRCFGPEWDAPGMDDYDCI